MSNTTCIRAIKHVSGIKAHTVKKLYDIAGIPQPRKVRVLPIRVLYRGDITPTEIHNNNIAYSRERNDVDVITYHIINDVYVTYIKEGVVL
jgi:hypothetical protein